MSWKVILCCCDLCMRGTRTDSLRRWWEPGRVVSCYTCKSYTVTVVEALAGCKPLHCANTIPGLERHILWWHGTQGRTNSDKGTDFWNDLINSWAMWYWVHSLHPLSPQPSGQMERYKGLLKTVRALSNGAWKHWDANLGLNMWPTVILLKLLQVVEQPCSMFTPRLWNYYKLYRECWFEIEVPVLLSWQVTEELCTNCAFQIESLTAAGED